MCHLIRGHKGHCLLCNINIPLCHRGPNNRTRVPWRHASTKTKDPTPSLFRAGDKGPFTRITVESSVAVGSRGAEVDEAGLVGGDDTVDPSLIFRHSGIYSREIGQGTSYTKAHHSRQDPLQTLFAHQRTTRVTLQGKRIKATMG